MPNPPEQRPERSIATPLIILSLGAVQVGVIYLLVTVDSPVRDLALRATGTWPGRIILAWIGLAVIIVGMITLLTYLERRKR